MGTGLEQVLDGLNEGCIRFLLSSEGPKVGRDAECEIGALRHSESLGWPREEELAWDWEQVWGQRQS